MVRLVIPAVVWLVGVSLLAAAEEPTAAPSGDAEIRGGTGANEIVVRTTQRLAGAIDSLTWGGKEFVDSVDHGRQIQTAANFDCGRPFFAETFNPTEAGSRLDGAGPKSSSRLLSLSAKGNVLETLVQPAFWLAPGEKSSVHPAYNEKILSDHRIGKRVEIGWENLTHVIRYDVAYTVPADEQHTYSQFEVVTGYMPPDFSTFLKFDPETGKLQPLDDGPGEQPHPVVLATADGRFAMGVYSPDGPKQGYRGPGYGRFRFKAEKVVKWNCVFRQRDPNGTPTGEHKFRSFVVVGSQTDCENALRELHQRFAEEGG
ncbi:MAG TPA: hypothetical protein VGE52_12630 [Pirellulales bacterium]